MPKPKADKYWRQKLTAEQYAVLRQKDTEAPSSGELLHNKESGAYACAACGAELFSSETKFDSRSGWPSFYDVMNNKDISLEEDKSLGMHRTEVNCAQCGGHLGHLFNDGPNPTGKRYCINSCALDFKPKKSK